ncbi:N-acetylmuramoyl-L-alanine amidase [uncultured Lutibacter sp.]|uniref:N-acetylmuramoyl-L-alanine amidase n=1 Tax=uncultured Lutibacter sp. TaxID=437739 RepID=UPI00260F6E75|nr:peptidoglycan recognition family protein [uncultured Lutibacter sp.]
MKNFIILISSFLFISCSINTKIVDKPIIFDDERELLTLEYMQERYGIEKKSSIIEPKMIVLHWTSIPTLQKTFEAFEQSKISSHRPDVKNASALNVSSQFVVDQDGTIYRLMPETTMARHVIGLNHCAIGIENVGGTKDKPLTKAQLKSNMKLVKYLASKYNIEYLIGHYEYTNFVGHELWLEKDASYRTKKTDPGKDFLENVKMGTKKLNFKTTPPIKVSNN